MNDSDLQEEWDKRKKYHVLGIILGILIGILVAIGKIITPIVFIGCIIFLLVLLLFVFSKVLSCPKCHTLIRGGMTNNHCPQCGISFRLIDKSFFS